MLTYGYSGINQKIEGLYPALDDYAYEISFGKHYVSNKGTFGLNMSYFFNNKHGNNGSSMFYGYGLSSNFEFNLFRLKAIRFYSLVDIAIRQYNIALSNTKTGGFSFYDALNKQVELYKFSNLGLYFDLGLGMNYFFDLWVYNFGVGISGGIRQNAGNTWKYEDIISLTGKLVRTNGFFVGLNFYINLNMIDKKS